MAAAFSRLQLAAALIEYDNDPTNPEAPFRSAHDSAIFTHLRRNTRIRASSRKSADYLGVSLPNDAGTIGGRESVMSAGVDADRRSQGSVDALRNPFGREDTVDDDYSQVGEEEVEVDLSSWGLDSFIPKEKESKSSRHKAKSRSSFSVTQRNDEALNRRSMGARSMSLDATEGLRQPPSITDGRRRSMGSALDLQEVPHTNNASAGSRTPLDDDALSMMSGYARDRPYSTLELLRPKVLVMPSPLQNQEAPPPPPPPVVARGGFQLSTDGPPLPPGARSARRSSTLDPSPSSVPMASNAFTPNPRSSLTLSQLTFRNTLMVGGQRDVSFADIDNDLPRAIEEGEQIQLSPQEEEVPENREATTEPVPPRRPAGKLFGKSLIDDLESRKFHLRSKQRVFTGDSRPSMMARASTSGGTLIDPGSLSSRPTTRRVGSNDSGGLIRRNSANIKPLLNFEDEKPVSSNNLSPNTRAQKNRSVFGVDTLWEREMVKLRGIEAKEAEERLKQEAEERKKQEAEEQREKRGKGKRKGRNKNKAGNVDTNPNSLLLAELEPEPKPGGEAEAQPRVSVDPPILPAIRREWRKGPPPPVNDGTDTESEESGVGVRLVRPGSAAPRVENWNSSDEEDAGRQRRIADSGPTHPDKAPMPQQLSFDDDSDEDVPLAESLGRALQRPNRQRLAREDSDEEQPLSVLLSKAKRKIPLSQDHTRDKGDDDDDDQPLGLRMSVAFPQTLNGGGDGNEDDDMPLALHPEQQRRTQYNMMAQMQQVMMMQAQMQNGMFFGPPPPMLSPGFVGPPLGNPVMMGPPAPLPMPSPPPVQDTGKYVRVDQWRHDVAVEGQK